MSLAPPPPLREQNFIAGAQTFLKALLGRSGFGGPRGTCGGDCRALTSAVVDLELTFITGLPCAAAALPWRSTPCSTPLPPPTRDKYK